MVMSIAPEAAQGTLLRAEALRQCDEARERVEGAIAALRAIDAGCTWRSGAIDVLRERLRSEAEELRGILDGIHAGASALRAG